MYLLSTALSTLFALYICPPKPPPFPTTPSKITIPWLTSTLSLGPSLSIKSLKVDKPSDSEQGMTSSVAFLKIEWEGDPSQVASAPKSIVVKYTLPEADIGLRVLFRLSKLATREAGFLRTSGPKVPPPLRQDIPSPLLYFFGIVEATQDFIILMEDMRERDRQLKPGVQGQTSIEDARKILKLQAKLHAKYMDREHQSAAKQFAPKPSDASQAFIVPVLKKSWPKFKKWAKAMGLDVEAVKSCGDEVVAKGKRWSDIVATEPVSLVHGDSHCENYLYTEGSETDQVSMIDFQLAAISQPLFDVANFLVLSLSSENFDAYFEELLDFYYAELTGHVQLDPNTNANIGNGESLTLSDAKRRFGAGLVYTLMLESVGVATASEASLNKQGQKRAEVAKKIINAIKTVEKVSGEPVSFYSYGDAGKDGAGNIHNGMSNNKVAPEAP
ncbi:hypothetical protein TrST_g5976 [Triparma strigata]|uniref:CHK kinase-like domain-containing protein n=1 Tax=Triparma strigata TaxID=1606541 RepID=A0A9W7BGN5_9STRA|nr:hypothetical protein TrST_g5976 [Triparma strigata]